MLAEACEVFDSEDGFEIRPTGVEKSKAGECPDASSLLALRAVVLSWASEDTSPTAFKPMRSARGLAATKKPGGMRSSSVSIARRMGGLTLQQVQRARLHRSLTLPALMPLTACAAPGPLTTWAAPLPCRAGPCRAVPCRAGPCRAVPL